jgi:predicted F0F1-ATPase subunit
MMMAAKDINLQELQKPADEASSKEKKKAPATIAMNLLAEVSTLAWNLVIPIVGGVLLGHYIDKRSESGITWTMSLLVLGVMIAFSNLYNLYIEHGRRNIEKDSNENTDEEINGKEEE